MARTTACAYVVALSLKVAALAACACAAAQTDVTALLRGVTDIVAPGVPGAVCAMGPDATAVIVGNVGRKLQAPVVVASRLGKGLILAFGHDGYLSADAIGHQGTGRLMANAVRWMTAAEHPKLAVYKFSGTAEAFAKRGFAASDVAGPGLAAKLAGVDVLVCDPVRITSPADLADIGRFVTFGGGLIAANTGWGWAQLHPGKSLAADHPGNQLLVAAGVLWTGDMLDRTCTTGFNTSVQPSELTNASRALDAILIHEQRGTKLAPEAIAEATAILCSAAVALPEHDTLLMPRLRSLQTEYADRAVPTEAKPLTLQMPLERLALTLQIAALRKLPADQIKAHPAAASFPGTVPANAPRVTRTVTVDTRSPDWHSIGLYAAPGETISVTVPAAAAGKGLAIRIGCHSDGLWHLNSWKRVPEICREDAIAKPSLRIASAFGGLIYVVVPRDCRLGTVDVQIAGAVESPYFVLGKTDPVQWRDQIRSRPAPWAELQGDKIIVTVPSANVRALDNPVELMEFWDHVGDACAELAMRPLERDRQERYVTDMQISAGYMHSGYPIMTFLDVAPLVVDLKKLRSQGSWGHFHEIGHNHQSSDWTFDGTGEVTENLFSLYVLDKVCGISVGGHPAVSSENRAKTMQAYFAAGPDFARWKSNPFLALYMYMQLQEAFGWEAYKRVFAEYRALPDDQRPKSDDEKRDQWMMRFSRTVGRNLGPFFETWGVPTTQGARAAIASLPVWMPESFPPGETPGKVVTGGQ